MTGSTAIDIVTIAHEHRSGGSALARWLGDRLGWPVLDHDLARRVAARLVRDGTVPARASERPTLAERVGAVLLTAPPDVVLLADSPPAGLAEAVAAAARAEIEEAAVGAPLVVVANGAECVLRDWQGTLHVNVVAPLAERIARLCAETRWPPAYAIAALRRLDHQRTAFLQRHHGADVRDPLLYDLQLNMGRLPLPAAGAAVLALLDSLRARDADPGLAAGATTR